MVLRVSAIAFLLSGMVLPATVDASDIRLTWNANGEPDLAGYTVHWGVTAGSYSASAAGGSETSYTVTGLEDGTTYFFAVSAVDFSGNESGYSSEISATPVSSTPEVVSAPSTPSGPATGNPKRNYTFLASESSAGDGSAVQYRFDWGDGTRSNWIPGGSKNTKNSWKKSGTYLVRAQARCAAHQEVESEWSAALSVEIVEDKEPPPTPGNLHRKNRV